MYFELQVDDGDQDFSWIIAKNPASPPFLRDVGAGGKRSVTGAFLDAHRFQVIVHNDMLEMLKEMRRRNMQAYVRAEPFVVCPANLKGIGIALRSALHGQPGEFDEARFWAPKRVRMLAGPVTRENVWLGMFEGMGLHASWTERFENMLVGELELVTAEPMSVTDALSRAYLGLHAISTRYDWDERPEAARVDRFLSLASRWLGTIDEGARKFLTARLSGYSTTLAQKFEAVAQGEDPETAPEPPDAEVKLSLHRRRHEIIAQQITGHPWGARLNIVDLGSGEGRLVEDMVQRLTAWRGDGWRYIGVDACRTRVARTRRRLKARGAMERVSLSHANSLWPRNIDELAGADVVVLSEVIEHLATQDRAALLRMVQEVIDPQMILLTTPNVEYNQFLDLPPGTFRHRDHKVEFDRFGLEREVIAPLSASYRVEVIPMDAALQVQPSFVVKAVRKPEAKRSRDAIVGRGRIRARTRRMNESAYFTETGVVVAPDEMLEGYTAHAFLANAPDIFYLGPNIAPVDHAREEPAYLEHPCAAFDYYRQRGIRYVVEEPKYMGSRAYVLAFREPEMAAAMHMRGPVIINSRLGARFFPGPAEECSPEEIAIWQDLRPGMEACGLDFVVLDAEMLPWGLKARDMIRKEFELPGHAALAWRRRFGTPASIWQAEAYLASLACFAGDGPMQLHAFHMLASGQVKLGPHTRLLADDVGMMMTHDSQLFLVDRLLAHKAPEGRIVHPARCTLVDLESLEQTRQSTDRWHVQTEEKGLEGFVYKPQLMCAHAPSGYPIQPALKVRGREYLRLIYGMDYLEAKLFGELRHRGTKAKRLLAVQQQEIANAILRAFIHTNDLERLRAIGAMLGLEEARRAVIDRTL